MSIKNKSLRGIGLFLLLGIFSITTAYSSNTDKKDKIKGTKTATNKEPEKKSDKTDSLAIYSERDLKTDSTASKVNNPSSMSSMSYNILFQVIYRFSFSEIFDSPSSSEIVTD